MHRVLQFRRATRLVEYVRNIAPRLFVQELAARPGAVGAICPSSRYLAAHMARQVPLDGGLVVELGGGTGAITQALLAHGVRPADLLVVEHSSAFVQRLRNRFSHLDIVQGDAADLARLVPPGRKISAIVSSLPLCSLPPAKTRAILRQWQELLAPEGRAIQFTYSLRTPEWRRHLPASRTHSKIVWANLPPANIMTFSFGSPQPSPP